MTWLRLGVEGQQALAKATGRPLSLLFCWLSLTAPCLPSCTNEYAAKVVDIGAKGVKVHYTGWKKSWCVPSDRHTRAKTERASQSESARER